MLYDPIYLLYIAPALLLAAVAQLWLRSTYARAMQKPASHTGAAAARHILDAAGLHDVKIEQVPGHLTDHYDSRDKVLQLSPEVYQGKTLGAVGMAAHEAGHAIQDARNYFPLVIRNMAVPAASFGSNTSLFLLLVGLAFGLPKLILASILLFSLVVIFQVINLPVEFNASSRAKAVLADMNIVAESDMQEVRSMLWAAALTNLAATLQAMLSLIYYISLMFRRKG
ncbi:MAG: zinc metallopeptidase [Blastopirellula sp.]|nr:MAG: zinc metallopeptidase [Blastopirellula sp.]